jgi:hypothetical protein
MMGRYIYLTRPDFMQVSSCRFLLAASRTRKPFLNIIYRTKRLWCWFFCICLVDVRRLGAADADTQEDSGDRAL